MSNAIASLQDKLKALQSGGASAAPVASSQRPEDLLSRLSDVIVPVNEPRLLTGISGLDTCIAEADDAPPGMPLGASVLLSGSPGGGKSTIATIMADAAGEVLVLVGDERPSSMRKRWDRLGLGKTGCNPHIAPITTAEDAMYLIRHLKPRLTIVDSAQQIVHRGSRKYDAQAEGLEMIAATTHAAGGSLVIVCHVDKSGTKHAGAQSLAHFVDIHLHVSVNTKKGERALEIRKNRVGRAGFQVQLVVQGNLLSVGTPAPISGDGSAVAARNMMELAAEKAYALLLEGKQINAYQFMTHNIGNGNVWRAGIDHACQKLAAEGHVIIVDKIEARKHWRLQAPPPKADEAPPPNPLEEALEGASPHRPIELT